MIAKLVWRVRAVALKLNLGLPEVSWGALLDELLRGGHWPLSVGTLVSGKVRPKQRLDDSPFPYIYDTPLGDFRGRLQDGWLIEILLREQMEECIYDHPAVRIRSGDVVLDCGGHIGTFARFALERGARQVVSIEPDKSNAACYRMNLEQEIGAGRAVVVEAGLWDQPGSLRFTPDEKGNSGSGLVSQAGKLEIRTATIDSVVEELGLDRVDFIKMDIEGAERRALAGGAAVLGRWAPRMAICTYHGEGDAQAIREVVRSARPTYQSTARDSQTYFYERQETAGQEA
jgi:FkbM family methyltransferase